MRINMDKNKIYITGTGAVTPIGIGTEAFWDGIVSGRCGIRDIAGMEEENIPVRRAGQVADLNPRDYLPVRLVQDLEPYMQYAYISAEEALRQSGLDPVNASEEQRARIGIVMGSALSGINIIGETDVKYKSSGRAAGPKFLTKAMGNICAAHFSINHCIKGPSMTVSTACSSGGDAITLAAMMIRSGMADAMVVMAGEAAICPTLIQSLTRTGALSKTGQSMPFDLNRNGFALGEGGGALILESEEHAAARGAQPLCELLGCANNTDAFNPVSPDPGGEGAAACMKLALTDAGIPAERVDYINAHGTATQIGDIAEACAIRKVFSGRPVPVSSTKGSTGHMMGAGGIVELIACIKAIETGILPVNTGFETPDPECDLNIVTEDTRMQRVDIAMSDALGFGGQNSCIIIGRA